MAYLDLSHEAPAESLAPAFQVSGPFLDLSREAPPTLPPVQVSAPYSSSLDLSREAPESLGPPLHLLPFNLEKQREEARGDLARGLLWLLTFAIGGMLAFVGLGRLDGTVITQSIFPSLVALAGTALGFYFGSQSGKNSDSGAPGGAGADKAGAGGGAPGGAGAGEAGAGGGAPGGAGEAGAGGGAPGGAGAGAGGGPAHEA